MKHYDDFSYEARLAIEAEKEVKDLEKQLFKASLDACRAKKAVPENELRDCLVYIENNIKGVVIPIKED
jgi:hypothetical protein